jgi:hypothetical protein
MQKWVLALTFTCSVLASAAEAGLPRDRTSPVDARVSLLFEHRAQAGLTLPLFESSRSFETTRLAPLIVRFRTPPSVEARRRWGKLGWVLVEELFSGALRIRASEPGVAAMLASGWLESVTVDLPPPMVLSPVNDTRGAIAVPAAAAAFRKLTGQALTGQGVVLGDMVAWVDVDKNGVLTPALTVSTSMAVGASSPRMCCSCSSRAASCAGATSATCSTGSCCCRNCRGASGSRCTRRWGASGRAQS